MDNFVDTVQTAKKTFVSTFVTNDKVADSLNKFVDAQTAYTKSAIKAGNDAATSIGKETMDAIHDALKFDWTKQFAAFKK
jgi:predicted phage gp36 major capsid-like protein